MYNKLVIGRGQGACKRYNWSRREDRDVSKFEIAGNEPTFQPAVLIRVLTGNTLSLAGASGQDSKSQVDLIWLATIILGQTHQSQVPIPWMNAVRFFACIVCVFELKGYSTDGYDPGFYLPSSRLF
jgi:hypothetical protein